MGSGASEKYIHGYEEWTRRWMSERTAANQLGFLLPHLRPGQDLIDCGCGPGSITVGLADAVAPGHVVGLDIEERQLEAARAVAQERELSNIEFKQGSVYELPFGDATFDVAVAHFVLEHVSEPLRALTEIRRVLRPGGIVAIKDPYYPAFVFRPLIPPIERGWDLITRVRRHNRSSEAYSADLRSFLLQAGFARTQAESGTHTVVGRDSSHPAGLAVLRHQLSEGGLRETVIQQGWATAAELDELVAGVAEAAQRPDLFGFVVWVQALGWVD